MAAFSEDFISENDLETVLVTLCFMTMVLTLLKQLRRSLQIKKIITNSPSINISKKYWLLGQPQRS